MTTLGAIPIDPDQLDLLNQVADNVTPLGELHRLDFMAACVADGRAHDGWVHPSRVSALLHERFGEINPRWLSAQWAPACGPKGFMDVYREVPARIDPKHSRGNGNKTVPTRRLRDFTTTN